MTYVATALAALADPTRREIFEHLGAGPRSVGEIAQLVPVSRPATRQISIRLNDSDIVEAQKLAAARGIPYQTYIKMLLHEAIQRERSVA